MTASDDISKDDGTWITDDFLQEILENEYSTGNISLVDKNIKRAVGKGDNYLSIIYRVEVQFKRGNCDNTERCHLIVKGLPDGEYIRKIIDDSGLFNREISIYSSALPEMCKFAEKRMKRRSVPRISPKSYITSRADTVVLQDLRNEGFVMANRMDMLDLQHCRIVVKTLARLHGMSSSYFKNNPEEINNYPECMYCEKGRDALEKFVKVQHECMLKCVKSWPGYETYASKLEKYFPSALDKVFEACVFQEDGFNVLNHGDCWINNILFKYSMSGEPLEMRFVDFQLARVGTPAVDLSYFLYSSPQNEVRAMHTEDLLRDYHTELTETLISLGRDAEEFSFQNLESEMRRMANFGFMTACNIMPIVVANAEDAPDMSEVTEENVDSGEVISQWEKIQNNDRFKEVFQQILPIFDKIGIYD